MGGFRIARIRIVVDSLRVLSNLWSDYQRPKVSISGLLGAKSSSSDGVGQLDGALVSAMLDRCRPREGSMGSF